ncbi:MAG: 3-phosphoshikimate 1-carboxyvinyltransferase [Candidatus Omnitrophica bacterium]|nr:3-phosphoshikimate 1-carboxyvinyltransferase [Candidatus Omnitrophota bacterium]
MKPLTIKKAGKLTGRLVMPGDKSVSHRAVMIGAIAKGRTVAKDVLDCDDCNYTMNAFRDMGISIKKDGEYTTIEGKGLRGLKAPAGHLFAGNSGTTMRLMAGILAGQDFAAVIDGAGSLLKRPMKRIIEPLSLMGVDIKSAPGGYPPITIKGGSVKPANYKMPIPSAQIKSAVLFAGLYAKGTTVVEEAFKSRDHTERMLEYFGAKIKVEGVKVSIEGGRELEARQVEVPGDISSASFFMAGAVLLEGSKIRIENVGINPARAGILDVLKKMGAKINVTGKKDTFEPVGNIEVESGPIRGITIEESMVPAIIDELPVIFVLAAFAEGKTVIRGADELKVKETDRIRSMQENLGAMGAKVLVSEGEIIIEGSKSLRGADLKSYDDHRTCMAMTIAALAAGGESRIDDVECVSKSFPGFFETLEGLK